MEPRMMRDPYEVLGVPRSANASAIKNAYRRLVKKKHPPAHKKNPETAGPFAALTPPEANPKPPACEAFIMHPGGGSREGFESFTWSPEGGRGGGGRRGFGGFEDVLKDMFGRAGGRGRTRFETHFEPEDFGEPEGRGAAGAGAITLAEGAQGA